MRMHRYSAVADQLCPAGGMLGISGLKNVDQIGHPKTQITTSP